MSNLFEPFVAGDLSLPNRVVMAPLTPFITDEIYDNLDGSEPSIHLCDFPQPGERVAAPMAQVVPCLLRAGGRERNLSGDFQVADEKLNRKFAKLKFNGHPGH
mgnify:CR=1 FL=1